MDRINLQDKHSILLSLDVALNIKGIDVYIYLLYEFKFHTILFLMNLYFQMLLLMNLH